jgi:hypothetical protein
MTGSRNVAAEAAGSEPIGWLARIGLAARAGIYLLIGFLAFLLALGSSGKQADQKGAMQELLSHAYGTVLVVILTIGFFGYALWRLSEAAFGVTGDGMKTSARVRSAVRGLAYLVLGFTAISVLRGSSESQSGQQETLTAQLMGETWGRLLVGLIGLIVLGVGITLIVEGVKLEFMRYFKALPPHTRSVVKHLGRVGSVGRGAVFGVVGILILSAAWNLEPDRAGGMDAAFRTILSQPYGQVLGMAAALALILFGVYGFTEARYRRV